MKRLTGYIPEIIFHFSLLPEKWWAARNSTLGVTVSTPGACRLPLLKNIDEKS